jgi:RNA polymerase sigma factor (sigma-70 family)
MSDHELLRIYARDRSQTAFADLVTRHLDLVYAAARRITRSPHLAEDVAQSVFLDLARRSPDFPADQPLVAWLHTVARRTAIDAVRREARRTAREQAAAELHAPPAPAADWTRLEPLLDDALAALPDVDRHAVLLRFFENRSFREIGAALGATDDAAQKRVSRALDHLRAFLARRGAPVSAAALAAELSAHAVLVAPAALGPAITAAASSLAVGVGSAGTASAVLAFLPASLLAAGCAASLALVVLFAGSRPIAAPPSAVSSAIARAAPPPPSAGPRVSPVASVPPAAPGSAVDLRVALLRQLAVELPAQSLPELRLLAPADWTEVAAAHELDTAADIRIALAQLRSLARKHLAAHLQSALRRFTAAHDGRLPGDVAQLAPHLDAPADAEMLARYELTRSGRLGAPDEKLLREKPTSDMLLSVGLEGWDMKNNSDHAPAVGESELDALARAAKSIETAIGPDGGKTAAFFEKTMPALKGMIDGMQQATERLYAAVGGEEAFGAQIKDAARRFAAAHPDTPLSHLGQVLPYLPVADQVRAAATPLLAHAAYLVAHPGQPPPGEDDLRRFLAGSPDLNVAFQAMKLRWEGDTLHFSYDFHWSEKKD